MCDNIKMDERNVGMLTRFMWLRMGSTRRTFGHGNEH
jgi:hypothetical protein